MVWICLALLLTACSPSGETIDDDDIQGQWESPTASVEMIGMIRYKINLERDGGAHVRVVSGDDQVRLDVVGGYVIQGNNLTFTGDIADYLSSDSYTVSMPSPSVLVLEQDGKIELHRKEEKGEGADSIPKRNTG